MRFSIFLLISGLLMFQEMSFASSRIRERIPGAILAHEVEFFKEIAEKNSCNPLDLRCETSK